MIDEIFKKKVYKLVATIPKGKVMTYGQVAAQCGEPRAAWEVGQIAHFGPENLPWQRVVNKKGGLASGFPGGQEIQKLLLEADGVVVNKDHHVDISNYLWNPDIS